MHRSYVELDMTRVSPVDRRKELPRPLIREQAFGAWCSLEFSLNTSRNPGRHEAG